MDNDGIESGEFLVRTALEVITPIEYFHLGILESGCPLPLMFGMGLPSQSTLTNSDPVLKRKRIGRRREEQEDFV